MPEAKLAPKVSKLKIPKTLGGCADLLFVLQQERLTQQKVADAIEANEKLLKAHIIDNLPKGDGGAIGKTHKVVVKTESIPQIDAENGGWEAFYEYVRKNKAFDLLQRRLNTAAIRERIEDGKAIPAIKNFNVIKLSLTKVL